MRQLLVLLLLSLGLTVWAQGMNLHVISRPDAQALVPVIAPLLAEGGTVNAYQGKLIVRTTDRNFAELQSLLGELNRNPSSVTVYLRRAGSSTRQDAGAGISINSQSDSGTDARLQAQRRSTHQSQGSDYQIRTLSGYPAGINQGTLLALSGGRNGTYLAALERGIQVTPQVNADGSVTLQIQQRYDQPGSPGIADTQHSASTLRLKPGQWQQIGAIKTVSKSSQREIGRYQTSRQTVVLPIEVMVEVNE